MSKKMLINATHLEENRVAIVEDGILSELDIEIAGKEQTRGNIYKGTVVRVEPGLQAAFIDYGGERMGFLQLGEIHPSYFKEAEKNNEGKGRPRITDVLRRGQELLLQVVKEERGTKGAALTTYLSLPGRYMVLMPDSDTKGVSRKIEEESQRRKLKDAMSSLDLPANVGYIVRTAGIGQSTEELKRDFDYLVRLYQNIRNLGAEAKAPALIYKESNLVIRSIRDYFSADMDEVLVDDPKVFQEAKDFFQQVMPEYARLVKLHQERRPIFARYQIEEQIETISKNKVPLPSGGSIVIDQTEALVAVDVNSGKMASEQGVEATAYKSNLEAAAEIGRQLRLRDLGGLIVIDFIDMRDRKHIREVERALKDALKSDKARVTVGRISQFGLLEMSRQRIKATLAEGAYLTCPHCFGSGRIKSPEAQAVAFLRKVQAGAAKGNIGLVEGEVPLDVAIYLLNSKRDELHEMERQRGFSIFIKGHPDFVAGQAELTFHKREKEKTEPEYVSAATAVALPMETAAEIAGAGQDEEAAAEPAVALETTESENAVEGEVKKKRRRRRRKKKSVSESENSVETATEETTIEASAESPAEVPPPAEPQAPAEVAPQAPTLSPEADEKAAPAAEAAASEEAGSKPKRRRSRRKKPVAAEVASEAGVPTTAEEAPTAAGSAQPRKEEPSPTPEAPAAASAPPEAPSETAQEKKPAARKRARAKVAEPPPAATTGEHAEPTVAAAENAPKDREPAAEAPPREKTTRSRKKPVKKATEEPATAEKTEDAPASDEEKAPPRRRGRPRKKAATGKSAEATGQASGADMPGESDSAPSAAKEAPEKAAMAAGEEAPKKTRPSRSRAKRTSPAATTEAASPDAAEEKTSAAEKPKKRAPRKKTAPAGTESKEKEESETT